MGVGVHACMRACVRACVHAMCRVWYMRVCLGVRGVHSGGVYMGVCPIGPIYRVTFDDISLLQYVHMCMLPRNSMHGKGGPTLRPTPSRSLLSPHLRQQYLHTAELGTPTNSHQSADVVR